MVYGSWLQKPLETKATHLSFEKKAARGKCVRRISLNLTSSMRLKVSPVPTGLSSL